MTFGVGPQYSEVCLSLAEVCLSLAEVCLYCSLTSCTTNLCLSDVPASTHSSNLMKAPVIGCGEFNRPPTALAPDGWLGPVSVSSGTVTRLREPEDLDAGCGKELQAEAQHETGSCN